MACNLKEEMQSVAFMIIASVGEAKSYFMEAIAKTRSGDFESARANLESGSIAYKEAHGHHFDLVNKEANDVDLPFSLLLVHAEDQLLTTEVIRLLAEELLVLYERVGCARVQ